MKRQTLKLIAGSAMWAWSQGSFSHENSAHAKTTARETVKAEQKPWGIAGEARAVTRSVTLTMQDSMRFVPDSLRVRQGETLRLKLHNHGKLLHELVIGDRATLDEHAALMQKFPDMEHDEPYMAHVPPGKSGGIVWQFNRSGSFQFACLIAGHYQAGMVGSITVTP